MPVKGPKATLVCYGHKAAWGALPLLFLGGCQGQMENQGNHFLQFSAQIDKKRKKYGPLNKYKIL
jgi:hypothetical protein